MKVVSQPSIFRFYVSLGSTDHQNSSKQILAEMFSLLKLSKWKISHQDRLPSQKSEPEMYMYIYIYLNPNDLCFDWKRPCFGGLKPQNRGQTGSRCIYIYICFFKNTYIYILFFLVENLGNARVLPASMEPNHGENKKTRSTQAILRFLPRQQRAMRTRKLSRGLPLWRRCVDFFGAD